MMFENRIDWLMRRKQSLKILWVITQGLSCEKNTYFLVFTSTSEPVLLLLYSSTVKIQFLIFERKKFNFLRSYPDPPILLKFGAGAPNYFNLDPQLWFAVILLEEYPVHFISALGKTICRAGHATSLPRPRAQVFITQNWWLLLHLSMYMRFGYFILAPRP